jgi:isopenicillin-N N-acyltransferase-like protein
MKGAVDVPVLVLHGDAHARGTQQATLCPDQVAGVRLAVDTRMAGQRHALESPEVHTFLAAQWDFARVNDEPGLAETQGIATGFGLAAETLFAYLHLNVIADMALMRPDGAPDGEGCTAWATRAPGSGGAWVVKNRDYRGEHGALQRVFRHEDPAWGGRVVLCVGSLGSPGAFSSGINSDGLAVVDTQIGTRDHGVGWLRYFLMSYLLRSFGTVADALRQIAALPHAGGGTLVMGDASGAVASVELGHRVSAIEIPGSSWTVRTNHFTSDALAAMMLPPAGDALSQSSPARLGRVSEVLQACQGAIDLHAIQALMAGHDQTGAAGLCRHAVGDSARTLSTVIYQTKIPSLMISHGPPCTGPWQLYALSDAFG